MSVVICTYTLDRWAQLQRAVRSIQMQDRPVPEIVVVIDHHPELLDRARATWPERAPACEDEPTVRVVPNTGARGLSGARNTGVEHASSEIVAFLDDDAEADVSWIDMLLAPYANPLVVACGGRTTPVLGADRPGWWPLEFDWVIGCSYDGLPTERALVRNLIGANMSARRAAVLEVGGFPEGIGRVGSRPLGCEETDLCIRISHQWPRSHIVYEPAARVAHDVSPARLSWRYFRSRCFAEGQSKAKVAARVGRTSALASERSYATKVLPAAMVRALVAAVRGEREAGGRAGAIAAGLAITTSGYLSGRVRLLVSPCPSRVSGDRV